MSDSKITLRFQGKTLSCRPGTSVAVALWENGIRVLSHSPKYGRPRGVTCARGQCTSCLMRVDGVPNVRTCETRVHEGMTVELQDSGAFYGPVMQKTLASASALFPVGFYYKWFTKPAAISRLFLNGIRPLTGVGRLTDSAPELRALSAGEETAESAATDGLADDLGTFAKIVVGAGPSGLAAALESEESVLVVDDHAQIGGQRLLAMKETAAFLGDRLERFPVLSEALRRADDLVERFGAAGHRFLGNVKVIAGYHPSGLLLRRGEELASADFESLVWAAGAMDRRGLFPGNDAPGLIGPRALYRLLTRDGLDVAGRQVLVSGGGLDFWLCAALLAARGARPVLAITGTGGQTEVSAAVDAGWQLNTGMKLAEIHSAGEDRLNTVLVPRQSAPGPMHSRLQLEVDLAVVCQDGKPSFDIPYQIGVPLTLEPERGGFVPEKNIDAGFAGHLPGGAAVAITGEAAGPRTDAEPARAAEGGDQ